MSLKRQKILDLVIVAAPWYIFSTMLHEGCHHITSWALGGSGYITLTGFWAGFYHFKTLPSNIELVYLMGGLGSAILMGLIAWRAWASPTKWDENHLFVLASLAAFQYGYGFSEPILYYNPSLFAIVAPILSCLFFLPAVVYFGLRWAKWLVE